MDIKDSFPVKQSPSELWKYFALAKSLVSNGLAYLHEKYRDK